MTLQESLAYWFRTNMITVKKKQVIINLAERIRTAKNVISIFVFQHQNYFIENITSKFSFYDFIINALPKVKEMLPSQVLTETLEDVYVKYNQRRDIIKDKLLGLTLCQVDKKSFEYYKKSVTIKTCNGFEYKLPKGAVKSADFKHKKSELTILIATLSLFFGENIRQQFIDYCLRNLRKLYSQLLDIEELIDFIDDFKKKEKSKNKKSNKKKEDKKEEKEKKVSKKTIEKSIKHFEQYLILIIDRPDVFERCLAVATARRKRILSIFDKPIVFSNLNFRGRSKVNVFLDENKNSKEHFEERKHHSKINAFLNLGGVAAEYGYKNLYVPVKFSKNYHGEMECYRKYGENGNNYQYIVLFDKNKNIRFQISKNMDIEYPDFKMEDMILIGGDENMKHNMEQFSDGYSIDWPRKKIDELVKVELKLDKITEERKRLESIIQSRKNAASASKQKADIKKEVSAIKQLNKQYNDYKLKENKLCVSIKKDIERSISAALVRFITTYGKDKVALVLENIDGMFSSNRRLKYICADGTEYSQNKIFRLCHFGEIKDMFKRIGKHDRYRVPVCLVPSYYSSQICPICGNIDRNNRTIQERVCCTECGHEFPADLKSA